MAYFDGIQAVLWDLINLIEATLILRFVAFHMGYKKGKRKSAIAYVVFIAVWSVMIVANELLTPNIAIAMWTNVILVIIYGKLYFDGTIRKLVFWYMIGIILIAIADTTVSLIILPIVPYDVVMGTFEIRMASALISLSLATIIMEIHYRLSDKVHNFRNSKISLELVICIIPAVVLMTIFIYSFMGVSKNVRSLMHLFIYLSIYIVLMIIAERYLSNTREKKLKQRELELVIAEDERRKQHYYEGHIIYEQLREQRHDAKHHLLYLKYLAEEQDYDNMKKYLSEYREEDCSI